MISRLLQTFYPYHRMTVRLALLVVKANLGGGHHKALVLDGTRPQQHLPMGATGGHGKRRRIGENLGAMLAQNRSQLGETHVVALRNQ